MKKAKWRAPIVEEIHRFREAYTKRLGYDSEKIFQDLRRRQEESGTPVISLRGCLKKVDAAAYVARD
jgi:hypothetical protein